MRRERNGPQGRMGRTKAGIHLAPMQRDGFAGVWEGVRSLKLAFRVAENAQSEFAMVNMARSLQALNLALDFGTLATSLISRVLRTGFLFRLQELNPRYYMVPASSNELRACLSRYRQSLRRPTLSEIKPTDREAWTSLHEALVMGFNVIEQFDLSNFMESDQHVWFPEQVEWLALGPPQSPMFSVTASLLTSGTTKAIIDSKYQGRENMEVALRKLREWSRLGGF
ncbi:hypothetical protein BDV10DRAFT_183055 [Aspergillus recurvatus]